jgi:cytochrome c553
MTAAAQGLSDVDIAAVAAYFSSVSPQPGS